MCYNCPMTQDEALHILKTGANVFLTGEPGAGKTHTINEYIKYLRAHEIDPAITASTGIAATHIGGLTIHSWSGIGIKPRLTKYDIDKIATSEYVSKRVARTKVLIIDEVSMLSPDTLSSVDAVCKEIKRNDEPFGGLQVIFVGDFFQLPPIVKKEEELARQKENFANAKQEVIFDEYNQEAWGHDAVSSAVRFAYGSQAWRDANPVICYISEQHRQDDDTFLSLLSAIRRNEFNEDNMECLQERKFTKEQAKEHYPKLFSRNINVDQVNTTMLAQVKGTTQTYGMQKNGHPKLVEVLTKGCLSPELLHLKIGAEVMCTKNNTKEGYVNGTLGTVVGFAGSNKYPIIETRNNKRITIEPADWIVEDNGKVKASISQLPLRLAWAITVHKSQGMSMDKAVMDLSDVFEYGQGYVALSRVRNLAGLYLLGYNQRAFQVHPEVLKKDEEFQKLSNGAEAMFLNLSKDEIQKMHDNFIVANGGVLLAKKVTGPTVGLRVIGGREKKTHTSIITLNMWDEGKDVYTIAKERKLSPKTIWGHIEDLVKDKKITYPSLARIITPEIQKIMPEISQAFKKLDTDKMTPIFEHFNGKYSYDDIRVVRMLTENV